MAVHPRPHRWWLTRPEQALAVLLAVKYALARTSNGANVAAGRKAPPLPPPLQLPPTKPRAFPTGNFIENELGEIRFPEISTPVLEVVCKYFYFKVIGWATGRASSEAACELSLTS